jgi:hypothetical protein
MNSFTYFIAPRRKILPASANLLSLVLVMFAFTWLGLATQAHAARATNGAIERAPSDFETSIDAALLFATTRADQTFALQVAPNRTLTLEYERVIAGADGARTWVGRVRDEANYGQQKIAYITEAAGQWYANVPTSDTIFEIVGGIEQTVAVRDLAARGYRRALPSGRDFLIPPVLIPREALPEGSANAALSRQKVLPSPQTTIDIMVVYTSTFVTRHGAGAAARINTLIAQANDSYFRSDVAITLRLVRSEQTAYINNDDNSTALNAFTNGLTDFASTAATRTLVGADLVVLLRPYDEATHSGCGVAWIGGFGQSSFNSNYGYAVVSEGTDLAGSGFYCPDTSLQHEMGHNMGLMHDRETVKVQNGGVIQFGATDYAFGYVIPGTTVGDIMSYANNNLNCFSSPLVFRQNNLCNVTPSTGEVFGVAGSDTTNSADAARALNFSRVAISNYRTPLAPTTATISGTIPGGAASANITFCARPAAGVTCSPSTSTGAYSCTVPAGWTGVLHAAAPAGKRIRQQSFSNVTTALSAQNPLLQTVGSCELDVDNNGLFEPDIDGLAILRRMAGFNVSAFSGLSGTCAGNTTSAAVYAATASNYNVTGGAVPRPTTDGLLITRAMRKLTGTAVTQGATSQSWATVQSWLNSNCGSNF